MNTLSRANHGHSPRLEPIPPRGKLPNAWHAVRHNRGSVTPGIDGVTRATVLEHIGVEAFLYSISSSLGQGTYRFWPPRAVTIAKGNGKTRRISIPTLRDRVVLMAMKFVLETIFEPLFLPCSFGFRPGLSPKDAVRAVIAALSHMTGPVHVVTADVASFFDSVDHAVLMNAVSTHVHDPGLLALLRQSLALSMTPGVGLPQGSPLSPLLGNIMLHHLDQQFWLNRDEGQPVHDSRRIYARYADDLTLLVSGHREDADKVLEQIRVALRELRLGLAEDKTRIRRAEDGFEMLGFSLKKTTGGVDVRPSAKSTAKLKMRLAELTAEIPPSIDPGDVKSRITAVEDGWAEYFNITR